jgi:hypothetical protein
MVLSGDSRCARCGSGQGTQGPHRAQARLRRCDNPECRAFILDSDTRCGHCGCEAPAFKAFRFGVAVLGRAVKIGLAVGIVVLLAIWVVNVEKWRVEHAPTAEPIPSEKPGSGESGSSTGS